MKTSLNLHMDRATLKTGDSWSLKNEEYIFQM